MDLYSVYEYTYSKWELTGGEGSEEVCTFCPLFSYE